MQRLQKVVRQALKQCGLERQDPSFQRCVDRLFRICHGYLKVRINALNVKSTQNLMCQFLLYIGFANFKESKGRNGQCS